MKTKRHMCKTTREQRVAIARIYARGPDWFGPEYPPTYRNFRETVMDSWDCLIVKAGGMIIGIEKDGYTHS